MFLGAIVSRLAGGEDPLWLGWAGLRGRGRREKMEGGEGVVVVEKRFFGKGVPPLSALDHLWCSLIISAETGRMSTPEREHNN